MMTKYLAMSVISMCITALAQLSFVWALFVDEDGNLPKFLAWWFQPPDSLAFGDAKFHAKEGKNLSQYMRAVVWIRRNGAQGFDLHVAGADAEVLNELIRVEVEGDITITGGIEGEQVGKVGWFCVRIGKYWHWRNIKHWPRLGIYTSSEFGWRLQGIAVGASNDICRQMVFTPVRVIKFVEKL